MYRRNLLPLCAIALLSLLTPSVAPAATGQVVSHSVAGLGASIVNGGLRSFVIAVGTSRNGTVSGLALIDSRGENKTFLVSVDSMKVINNQAVMVGYVVWSSAPVEIGLACYFAVQDNGKSRSNPDLITRVNGVNLVPEEQAAIHDVLRAQAELGTAGPYFPVSEKLAAFISTVILGDIQVR